MLKYTEIYIFAKVICLQVFKILKVIQMFYNQNHRWRNRGGGAWLPQFFSGEALKLAFISTILPLHECI